MARPLAMDYIWCGSALGPVLLFEWLGLMALRSIYMARPYGPACYWIWLGFYGLAFCWDGSAFMAPVFHRYDYLCYRPLAVWVGRTLLAHPSSCHCPARGWPPDRLSTNCRRAYGWVERCSCPVSCTVFLFNYEVNCSLGLLSWDSMHWCSYTANMFYGFALLIIASSDVEKNRYRDFWRCTMRRCQQGPTLGLVSMHLMRKGIWYVYAFTIWQPASRCLLYGSLLLCVYYMAACIYVFIWQPAFMCLLYGSLHLCVYMAACIYVFIWQSAFMCW